VTDGRTVRKGKEEKTAGESLQFISRRFGRKRSVRSIALAIPAEREVGIRGRRTSLSIREADRGLGSTLGIRKAEPKTRALPKTREIAEKPKLKIFECSLTRSNSSATRSNSPTSENWESGNVHHADPEMKEKKEQTKFLTFKT
jgi:hypothetical protein